MQQVSTKFLSEFEEVVVRVLVMSLRSPVNVVNQASLDKSRDGEAAIPTPFGKVRVILRFR
jgi:hypothetical protein